MVNGGKNDNLNKIEALYENFMQTGTALKAVRHETDMSKIEGVLAKRDKYRAIQPEAELNAEDFGTKMGKTYGGTANMTADKYLK
jgi:hypothetical protein